MTRLLSQEPPHRGPGKDDILARYAASRSVALLLTVLIALGVRSRMAIAFLGIAMTVVQAFDGVIGALAHGPFETYGPFALALLNALASRAAREKPALTPALMSVMRAQLQNRFVIKSPFVALS
jgi:hypothetical protein